LRKAERALKIAENKLKEALRQRGVQVRKDEGTRKAFIKQYSRSNSVFIPPEKWVLIRDPQKEPTADKIEALRPS
jgi:hypothetical protein